MRFSPGPVAVLAVLALALSGCSDDPAPAQVGSGNDLPTQVPGANETLDGPLQPVLGEPQAALLYLAPDGLSFAAPTAGAVSAGTSSTAFVTGVRPTEFLLPPSTTPFIVDNVDARLHAVIASDLPQYSNQVFDLAAWLGSTAGHDVFAFTTGEPAMGPGAQSFDVPFEFDGRRGLFVPAGESLRLYVTAQIGSEASNVDLQVGGEDPSYLALTLRNYTADPLVTVASTESTLSGSLTQAFSPVDCNVAPGVTSLTHDIAVAADTQMLRLALSNAGSPVGNADLDMVLSDAQGPVASTATPFADETILLAADTLAGLSGATLTLTVYACGPGPVNYEVVVQQMPSVPTEPPQDA